MQAVRAISSGAARLSSLNTYTALRGYHRNCLFGHLPVLWTHFCRRAWFHSLRMAVCRCWSLLPFLTRTHPKERLLVAAVYAWSLKVQRQDSGSMRRGERIIASRLGLLAMANALTCTRASLYHFGCLALLVIPRGIESHNPRHGTADFGAVV